MKFEKLLIPSAELGVRLEVIVAKPGNKGPFPAVVFNHGSTGRGQNRSLYSRTVAPAVIAGYFVEQGWMAVFPQRRGRGKSGGAYGEGLAPGGFNHQAIGGVGHVLFLRAGMALEDHRGWAVLKEDMDVVARSSNLSVDAIA